MQSNFNTIFVYIGDNPIQYYGRHFIWGVQLIQFSDISPVHFSPNKTRGSRLSYIRFLFMSVQTRRGATTPND